MTGPILVVGGRHRKGSAIPAVPHLAQLQSPIYQWVLTGLPGSTLGTWRFCERDRPLPLSPFSFTGDRGFESRFLRQRVGTELLSTRHEPREFHRREATPLATSCSICDETAGEGGRASGLSCPRLDLPQHRSNGEGYQIWLPTMCIGAKRRIADQYFGAAEQRGPVIYTCGYRIGIGEFCSDIVGGAVLRVVERPA